MGKLGEAIDAESVIKGPPCDTAILLESMEEEDAEDLLARLKDKSIPCTIIQEKLDEFSYRIGVSSLRRHRNRLVGKADKCQCLV